MVLCSHNKRSVTVQHFYSKEFKEDDVLLRPRSVLTTTTKHSCYDISSGSDRFYKDPYCGKGRVLFTGPDGVRDHRVGVLEANYVGIGIMSPEGTSELSYLWRAAPTTPHPPSKVTRVGEIGWGAQFYNDRYLLRSNNQIKLRELRQLAEDRHTHLYQNPWTPNPHSNIYKSNPYGREFTDAPKLNRAKLLPHHRRVIVQNKPKTFHLATKKYEKSERHAKISW